MSAHTVPRTATAFDFVECMGGRDRYIERMLNHHRKLDEMTSALRLEGPKAAFEGGLRRTPRPAAQKSDAWKRAHGTEFREVREAQRRSANVKMTVDNKWKPGAAPADVANRLSRNRRLAAAGQFAREEHERRQLHLQRRIASRDSLTERKKNNAHDWKLNPPLRMRKSASMPPDQLWKEEAERRALHSPPRPSSARPVRPASGARGAAADDAQRPSSVRARPASAPRSRPPPRPASARAGAGASRAGGLATSRGGRPQHGMELDPHGDFLALRESMLQEIVTRRLYKEQDLRRFLTQVSRDSAHLDQMQLQAVLSDVRAAFFL